MINNIFTKLGIVRSTFLVSIFCILASMLISFIYANLTGMMELRELLLIAAVCPALIAPPVVYFYAHLTNSLDENRLEQEDMNKNLMKLNRELTDALKKVKLLSGLLPICSVCKKVRDDRGYWNKIESFIKERSNAEFVRGYCPECARHYPGMTEPERASDQNV